MQTTQTPSNTSPTPRSSHGAGHSILAGLLAGAAVGLIGAVASVPLRRLANVSDRALVNGVTVVGGAIVLWLVLGALHAALRSDARRARTVVLAGAIVVAVAGTLLCYTALSGFADRLASLAVPLLLWVTLGGAALFLAIVDRDWSLSLGTIASGSLIAALVAGVLVAAMDTKPKVHYTLSKLPAPAATRAAAPSAAATSAATSAAGSTSAGSPAAGTATTPASGGSQAAAEPAGPLHFTVASGSETAFTVNEKLTRLPSPSDAVGKTQSISGDVYLVRGQGVAQTPPSTISVDLSTLATDSAMRDNFIKRSTLQTSQFPTATYTVTGIDGFPTNYKEGDEAKVTVHGTMQVHGVQKPVDWTGTARYAGGQLEAVLSTDVKMTDFGMTPPQVPVVQSVSDNVHLDLHLFATQQGS